MNTIWADRHGVHDALTSRGDLTAWLHSINLTEREPSGGAGGLEPFAGPERSGGPAGTGRAMRVTSDDLGQARGLRDALRLLAAHRTADPRPLASVVVPVPEDSAADLAAAVAVVNEAAAARDPARLRLRDGRLERDATPAGPPATAALAAVATQAIALLTGPDAPPLRACLAPGCVLYFVQDHPRREWCCTGCGNRARVARHYQRHHSKI